VSTTETLLYLVVIPAVVVAVIWVLAYRGGPGRGGRYRPGRPFAFTPVWYLADHHHPAEPSARATPEPGRVRAALPAAVVPSGDLHATTGGASERW
jgi:hypothetical protein